MDRQHLEVCSSAMKKLFTISALFVILSAANVWTSTGNTFPGTGANNAGIGATAWTNPTDIVSDNATDASCTAAASSQYLVASNFGFTLPFNASITGITVRIEASESSSGTEALSGRLQDASAALFGSTKSATISGTSKAVYTYGSSTDIWTLNGTTLTRDIVNDADFGVRFWYTTSHNMLVDYVTVAIEYNQGGGFFRSTSKSGNIKTQNIK